MPTWHEGDELLITPTRKLRIVSIDTEIADELVEQGFTWIW